MPNTDFSAGAPKGAPAPSLKITWRTCAVMMLLVYSVVLTLASLIELRQLHFRGDLAAIWQSIYSLAFFGHPWSSFNCSVHQFWSIAGTPQMLEEQAQVIGCNQLGVHFHGLIYPLALLARLFPTPELLIYVQSAAIAGAGWLLFLLAEGVTRSGAVACLTVLGFLINPFLHGLHLNDFHFDAFIPLFLFGALYLLQLGRSVSLLVLTLGAVLVKESFPLLVLALGAVALIRSRGATRAVVHGLGIMVVGGASFYLLTTIIIPKLSFTGGYMFGSVYGSKLGHSAGQIVHTSITQPWLLWESVSSPENQSYLALLLGSTSILALVAPDILLLGTPLLFINLVSTNLAMKIPWGQYNAAVIAACAAAIPFGFERLSRIGRRWHWIASSVLAASLALNIWVMRSKTHLRFPDVALLAPLSPALTALPPTAKVCTDDLFSIYASSRAELYLTPVNLVRCDTVLWQNPPADYFSPQVRADTLAYIESEFQPTFKDSRLQIYVRRNHAEVSSAMN